MIAFKTWLQAPSNPENVPTEWPWIEESFDGENEQLIIDKLQAGFQVLSDEAFLAYKDAHDEDYNDWYNSPEQVAKRNSYSSSILIKTRKEYSENLMERFKAKNISEGINAVQAMHMHDRLRALPVTFSSQSFTLDILNMAISGDVEVACLSLMSCTADDMSLPKHWLSQARINWLVNDMKTFLGWT
jgi:hypothetical protein